MAERPVKVELVPMSDEMIAALWQKRTEAAAAAAEFAAELAYRRRPWYRRWF